MTQSPSLRLRRPSPPASSGFTLVELLLVSLIGGIVLAGTASLVVSHIRAAATQITIQQRRTEWRKFTYLLATEVGEADVISSNISNIPCDTTNLEDGFALETPILSDINNAVVRRRPTFYYTVETSLGNDIYRCGPPVNFDGTLDGQVEESDYERARLAGSPGVTYSFDVVNNVLVRVRPNPPLPEATTEFSVSTRTGRIN